MAGEFQIALFAIQAAVSLQKAGRAAVAKKAQGASLNLPLPSAPAGPAVKYSGARNYYLTDQAGQAFLAEQQNEWIREALESGGSTPDDSEEKIVVEAFKAELIRRDIDDSYAYDTSSVLHVLTVKQWTAGEAGTTPLQIIAGTVLNLAVDYFVSGPGEISDKRPAGRALKSVLTALDKVNFSDGGVRDFVAPVAIAIVDSVASNPDIITTSDGDQKFIKNVATALGEGIEKKKGVLTDETDAQETASEWLELIARALIEGGSQSVLEDPKTTFGLKEPQLDLVRSVGQELVEVILEKDNDLGANLRTLLSGKGLNVVVKASLEAVSKNPDVLGIKKKSLTAILKDVATHFAANDDDRLRTILPEAIAVALNSTAENLDLVWPDEDRDPTKNIAFETIKAALPLLAEAVAANDKKLLNADAILKVAKAALDAVVLHPDLKDVSKVKPVVNVLTTALTSGLDALAKTDLRLTNNERIGVLNAVVKGAILNEEIIGDVSGGPGSKKVITDALDKLFAAFAEGGMKLRLNSSNIDLVAEAAEAILTELADAGKEKFTAAKLANVENIMKGAVKDAASFTQIGTDVRLALA